ncbi:MAG: competence/damage-inducible protein A [Rhodospirillales bacterium]|nr:competence/damage-inducible protein A [Rhodospirillales bacterium]MBO6786134.1 competence/damage-inducible protein A [Rhodospirillales bacterium]
MSDTATPPSTPVTAGLVIIGNEILSGRTKDANLQFLGEELNQLGIRLTEVRVVSDVPDAIIEAVNTLRARYTYVFTTGGIGPTHDDITSECVAKAFDLDFGPNPEAVKLLEAHYTARGDEFTPARQRMANTPVDAVLIDNPVSVAPGFQVENVFVLPGVPRIMQTMFAGMKHRLTGGRRMVSRTVSSLVPEGRAGGPLTELQARHPETEIGSYPLNDRPGANIVIRAEDPEKADAAALDVVQMLKDLGGEPVLQEPDGA